MNLFIVESPAKAKTIKQYLGKDFEVIASIGHIRELLQHNDGVDVDNDFHLNYQIIAKSKPQVKKICDLAKQANRIYLASDPDREGEAIAQSLYDEIIKKKVAKPDQFYRITYTEITENAIKNALKNPRKTIYYLMRVIEGIIIILVAISSYIKPKLEIVLGPDFYKIVNQNKLTTIGFVFIIL